jgi:hypothetical protein
MRRRDFFKGLGAVAAFMGLPGVAKALDHGDLDSLADDDHIQYFQDCGLILDRQGIESVKFLVVRLDEAFQNGDDIKMSDGRILTVLPWAPMQRCPTLAYDKKAIKTVFTPEQKARALLNAVCRLNEIPPFTDYTFTDRNFVMRWSDELVTFSTMLLLLWKREHLYSNSLEEIDRVANICYLWTGQNNLAGRFEQWYETVRRVKDYEAGIMKVLTQAGRRLNEHKS